MNFTVTAFLFLLQTSTSAGPPNPCPTLPAGSGLVWTYQQGPDFGVCYAADVNTKKDVLGVYLGYYPSFSPDPNKPHTKGIIDGHAVDWYSRDLGEGKETLVREALVSDQKGVFAHVWVMAESKDELAQHMETATKMLFKK